MPTGLCLSAANVNLDGFLAFVMAKGAALEGPCADSGEIIRFKIDRALGAVARRNDGRLTFCGVARPMVEQMMTAERASRQAQQEGKAA